MHERHAFITRPLVSAPVVLALVLCISSLHAKQPLNQSPVYELPRIKHENGYVELAVPNPLPWPWDYEVNFGGVGVFSNNTPFQNLTWREVEAIGGLPMIPREGDDYWDAILNVGGWKK